MNKKIIKYKDDILDEELDLSVKHNNKTVEISLPISKSFFRGISFSEKVKLKKLASGKWIKHLRAKFGDGGEELFGTRELNEESPLEARDIRIIARVEKALRT